MTYNDAKRKVIIRLMCGLLISLPSILSTIISVLKMFYYKLDDGTNFGHAISAPFKALTIFAYENTSLLRIFWEYSPVVNPFNFLEKQSIYFFIIYILFFIGWIFIKFAFRLKSRLNAIDQQIEDQLIKESIQGSQRTRSQIENSVTVGSSSKFHDLYIAPLIVAIIGAVIIKLLGLGS